MNWVFQFFRWLWKKLYTFFKHFIAILYAICSGLCILAYTVCKALVMVIGFLSILSYNQSLFDHRPFKFEYLHPIELGQAFFDLRYPISPHLSLSYVLDDLRKAGAECVDASLTAYDKEEGYTKVVRCVYGTGWLGRPSLTNYVVAIYTSNKGNIREITFDAGYMGP